MVVIVVIAVVVVIVVVVVVVMGDICGLWLWLRLNSGLWLSALRTTSARRRLSRRTCATSSRSVVLSNGIFFVGIAVAVAVVAEVSGVV